MMEPKSGRTTSENAVGRPMNMGQTWMVTIILALVAGLFWGAACDLLYDVVGSGHLTSGSPGAFAGGLAGLGAAVLWCLWTGRLVRRGWPAVRTGMLTGIAVGALAGLPPHLLLSYLHAHPTALWVGNLVTGLEFGAVTGLVAGAIAGAVLAGERRRANCPPAGQGCVTK